MNGAFMAFACMLSACAMTWGQEAEYESFEDGAPAYFTATRGESLSTSTSHSKQGQRSLRWDWRQGEQLVIRHGIGDVSRRGGIGNSNRACFSVWLYMEAPISGAVVFEFREGDKVAGFFRFPLEFTGWRQGRPFYGDLLRAKPTAKVDNIRIAAPSAVAKGTVFLDLIKYNTLTHPGREILPEREAKWHRPVPDERRHPKPDRVTEAELAGIRSLLGPDEGPGIPEARVKRLCDRVKALGIVRDEHGVHGGPGIDRHYQYCCEFGDHGAKTQDYWPDEHGAGWLGVQAATAMTSLGHELAAAYRASRDAEQRRRLAEAFLLVEEHLYDQGMHAAAGFHWNWWVGGAWADAVFLMHDVLAKARRLERQCDYFLWNWGGGEVFAEAEPRSHMDYYLLDVPRLLRACLIQHEAAEQVRWLRAFKAMLERSMLQPASALKIDGCAYHHGGHYFGYAFAAVPGLAETVHRLSGTPWRLNAEAHERLRRAALAQRIFCNQRDLPLSLSGRQPFSAYCSRLLPEGLDRLARCGTPDGTQAIDPEAAAAYLRLVPEAVTKEPYHGLGIKPEPEPNGCFVMPYAALLCQRRDNWLASVHGQSKYVWGTERQSKVNCFGLFQGLGHVEILAGGNPVGAKASGREAAGWDWRRFEGTTVPQLPLEQIDKGWTSAYSPETFAGGLSHQGRQGVFAMILNQPMPGGKTLKGRKTWFFNDDRILCLGSNISCDEAEHATQTTLCQKRLPKNKKVEFLPTRLDGADFAGFPEERTLDPAKPHWLLDVQQTGYYLPAGQKVTVARRHQTSREYQDQGDTEGDFLTAWIDHGKVPRAESYEYLLVVRTTPEAMQAVAAKPPCRVLQRDQSAHIVWDIAGRRWGCALFVPQEVTPRAVATETLLIKSIDRPCLVMAEAVQDGRLDMTVTDPDLNLERSKGQSGAAASSPRPLRLTLHGAWRLLEATGSVCAWRLPNASANVRILSGDAMETVLEILCQHGASYGLRFARR
jgi:chondroitin-sulfate-ABC endolyase/exolyase